MGELKKPIVVIALVMVALQTALLYCGWAIWTVLPSSGSNNSGEERAIDQLQTEMKSEHEELMKKLEELKYEVSDPETKARINQEYVDCYKNDSLPKPIVCLNRGLSH